LRLQENSVIANSLTDDEAVLFSNEKISHIKLNMQWETLRQFFAEL